MVDRIMSVDRKATEWLPRHGIRSLGLVDNPKKFGALVYDIRLALRTTRHRRYHEMSACSSLWNFLKMKLFATLIASCAYIMRRFSVAFISFQRINQCSRSQPLQLIALLLSIPCFKASHLCFKIAYAFQQRRLRHLCSKDLFLQFYDSLRCG